jgi:hypothetical protein
MISSTAETIDSSSSARPVMAIRLATLTRWWNAAGAISRAVAAAQSRRVTT